MIQNVGYQALFITLFKDSFQCLRNPQSTLRTFLALVVDFLIENRAHLWYCAAR